MKSRFHVNAYFLLSFLIIFLLKYQSEAYQNSLLVNAEVWAETGTNYFVNSQIGFWSSLFKTDCSYFVIIQRLISSSYWFFFKSPAFFFQYCGWISLVFIVLCCSYINCEENRSLIPNDLSRFALSLCLSFVKDYELHTFVNFVYFGWIPVLLIIANADFKSLRFPMVKYLFVFLILLSKATFIVALPLIIVSFLYGRTVLHKHRYFKLFLILPLLVQALMLHLDFDNVKIKNDLLTFQAGHFLWALLTSPLINLARLMFYDFSEDWKKISLFIFFCALAYKFRKHFQVYLLNKSQKTLIAGSLIIFCANHALILLSSKNLRPQYPNFIIDIIEGRAFYVGVVSVFIALWILLENLKIQKTVYKVILFLLFIFWSSFKPLISFANPKPPTAGNHDVRAEVQRLGLDQYCIPINPYPWFLLKNCAPLTTPPDFSQLTSLEEEMTFKISENLNSKKIFLIGLKVPVGFNLAVEENGLIEHLGKTSAKSGVSYFRSSHGFSSEAKLIFYKDAIDKSLPKSSTEALKNILIFGN